MMLGGRSEQYRSLYENFVVVAHEHLFFRPMTIGDKDILISGTVTARPGLPPRLNPELQHLTCFTGGMLAIAGKIFQREEDLDAGKELADGCVWAYKNTITGIMPETLTVVPCSNRSSCEWDERTWWNSIDPNAWNGDIRDWIKQQQLSPGFVSVRDRRYLLR